MKLILASASPRRREILKNAGFEFEVKTSEADETLPEGISPEEAVQYLAKIKNEVIEADKNTTVISADTIVVCDGRILGKPKDETDAFNMLRTLSGREHFVYTGVCIRKGEKKTVFFEKTAVYFYELSDREISDYIATDEPTDKAGAYGIQGKGAVLVRKIDGDYFNVVGLPIARLVRELHRF